MKRDLVRRVLIRERELKTLRHRALIKSKYGNRKLYDTCEWRPITSQDMLVYMLKGDYPTSPRYAKTQLELWLADKTVYDRRYKSWDLQMIDDILHICPMDGPTGYMPFGWATLTKKFT